MNIVHSDFKHLISYRTCSYLYRRAEQQLTRANFEFSGAHKPSPSAHIRLSLAKVRVGRSNRLARSKILQRKQMLETVLRGRFLLPHFRRQSRGSMGEAEGSKIAAQARIHSACRDCWSARPRCLDLSAVLLAARPIGRPHQTFQRKRRWTGFHSTLQISQPLHWSF